MSPLVSTDRTGAGLEEKYDLSRLVVFKTSLIENNKVKRCVLKNDY